MSVDATRPAPLSVRRNMLFNTFGSLFYQGCLWLTTVLVVILSSDYASSGMLAFAMTVGNMYTAVATYSMRTYQVSDVDGRYAQSAYVAFRVVTVVGGLAALAAYAAATSPDVPTLVVTCVFLLFKADESFCDVLYGVDQAGGRMDYIGISQLMRGLLVITAFLVGMVVSGLGAAVALMLPAGLVVTIAYDIPHAARLARLRPRITRAQVASLLVECAPVVVSTLLMASVVAVARQWFGIAFGLEQLGLYAAVATPAVLIQAGARFLYAPALVPLAERWGSTGHAGFVAYLRRVLVIMGVAVVVTVVALTFAGPPLLVGVYGQSLAPYTYLFTNVLASTGAIAFMWLLADVLVICRDLRGMLLATVAALAVTAATMLPLEGAFGMQGVNYTIIVGMLAGIAVAAVRVRRAVRRGR